MKRHLFMLVALIVCTVGFVLALHHDWRAVAALYIVNFIFLLTVVMTNAIGENTQDRA